MTELTSSRVLLSVVIPCLNEAITLPSAVLSINQSATREPNCTVEVIVVDGGSQDDTVAVAGGFGVNIVETHSGRGRQLTQGAEAASGEWLLFLHADATIGLSVCRQLLDAFSDETVIGGCFRQRIDANGFWYRWIEWGNAWRARRLGAIYGDQALFVRANIFAELGGFRDIPLMEDYEFSRRLRRRGKLVVLDGPVGVSARRWQQQGVIYSTLRNWCFILLFRFGVSPERLARWYRNVR